MNRTNIFVAAAAVSAISVACIAQEDEEDQDEPIGYSYATYSYCTLSGQSEADEIVKKTEAPVYNELVKEGAIQNWGWLSHHTGGQWRRVFFYSAESVNDLLDAQDAMSAKFDALDSQDNRSDICYAHDDYIWAVDLAGGDQDAARADAGFSVYYICNESTEDRADEIFESTFAPLLEKARKEGKIASWSWLSHFVGGKYRRLQSITGADHKALLAARDDLLDALYGGDEPNAEAMEFNAICNGHTDYMWNTVITSP